MSAVPWTPFGEWNNLGGHLQRWAATNIVTVPKLVARTKMLQFEIEVAYFLFKISNYDGCYRILEGLKLLALPSTWAALSSKVRAIHEKLSLAIRQLFADVTRVTAPSYPHIPIIETFTNALQRIGLREPRFRDPIPISPDAAEISKKSTAKQEKSEKSSSSPRRWIGSSVSSNALRVEKSYKSNEGEKKSAERSGSPLEKHKGEGNPLFRSHPGNRSGSSLRDSSGSNTHSSSSSEHKELRLNMTRAHSEAVLLSRLRSFQSKPFPFAPVTWIADFVSRASPLSIWTIQEYCETLEPTKYSQTSASTSSSSAARRQTSVPRSISSPRPTLSAPGSPISTSPPPSPRPDSPDSSPRGFSVDFSPQLAGWMGAEGLDSLPSSANSSPPSNAPPTSPRQISPSSSSLQSSSGLLMSGTSYTNSESAQTALNGLNSANSATPSYFNANFSLRRQLNRNPTPIELELERLGFFVFSSPPSSSDDPKTATNTPSWWILLDEDRLEENEDPFFSQLLLEYLPMTSWESVFTLSPVKAACINMKTSKITSKFKEAARLKFRKDFCFAAPSHSKTLKLSSYRIVNMEATQYVSSSYTITLTNATNAPLDFEVCASVPYSPSPHITKSEAFVAFSPSNGTIAAGKSISVKITAVLLEEVQLFKIFKIQAYWADLGYTSFVPLMLVQTISANAPSADALKEFGAATTQITSPTVLDEMMRKLSMKYPKPQLSNLDMPSIIPTFPNQSGTSATNANSETSSNYNSQGSNPEYAVLSSSAPQTSSSFLAAAMSSSPRVKEAFWKIPFEDLKPKRRLGGTQAGVSLCNLYGADVVLKKWDIGSLDPVPPEFMLEFEALRTLRHPNLVQLLGAQATKGVAFVVTEYVTRGTLQDLFQSGELRRKNTLSTPLSIVPPGTSSPPTNSPPAQLLTSEGQVSHHASASSIAAVGGAQSPPNQSGSWFVANATVSSPSLSYPLSGSVTNTSALNAASVLPPLQLTSTSSKRSNAICRVKLGLAADIASAMAYMHYRSQMHRDLKSLNVLVDECFRAKVADLGSSRSWGPRKQMTSGVGSYDWIAPEVLISKDYSSAADVFSYGLILWEIVHEQFPDRPMDMVSRGGIPPIDAGKFSAMFSGDPASYAAIEFEKLILKCCDPDPNVRPSFADIVILLEQILSMPLSNSSSAPTPRASHVRNASASMTAGATSVFGPIESSSDTIKRSASSSSNANGGDLWIRAMKSTSSPRSSATTATTAYFASMSSSPSSPNAFASSPPIASALGGSGHGALLSDDDPPSPSNASPPHPEDSAYLPW